MTEELTERGITIRNSRSMNEWAVSGLAELSYAVAHHLDVVELYWKFLPKGQMKDFFRVYRENQNVWKQKMIRIFDDIAKASGEGVGKKMGVDMRRDMNGEELLAYMDATATLKKFQDLENGSDILKLLAEVKDISSIKTNLKLIIQNQINKEEVCD